MAVGKMRRTNWMAFIGDDVSLSDIHIPGTHDSATGHGRTGGLKVIDAFTITQSLTIRAQLDYGIRFLDIRVALKDCKIEVRHGSQSLKVTLEEIARTLIDFLGQNPSETIIITMKNDDDGSDDDCMAAAYAIFDSIDMVKYANSKLVEQTEIDRCGPGANKAFYRERRLPSLNEVRGKVVVWCRSSSKAWFGLNIRVPNNTVGTVDVVLESGSFKCGIQDVYDAVPTSHVPIVSVLANTFLPTVISSVGDYSAGKLAKIKQGYSAYSKDADVRLRIGFTSANTPPAEDPDEYAQAINPQICRLMRENAGGKAWISPMDFVSKYGLGVDEPVAGIISMNNFARSDRSNSLGDRLLPDQRLTVGTRLLSASGAYEASMDASGSLRIIRLVDDQVIKSSGAGPQVAAYFTYQDDANLVAYTASGTPVTATHSDQRDSIGEKAMLGDDGRLILYTTGNKVKWDSANDKFYH